MDQNTIVKIRAGFMPVEFGDFFCTSLVEKGSHLVQHVLNVEEIQSGKIFYLSNIFF